MDTIMQKSDEHLLAIPGAGAQVGQAIVDADQYAETYGVRSGILDEIVSIYREQAEAYNDD